MGNRLLKTGSSPLPWLARGSTEHGTELAGLGLMAAGSADELRQNLAARRGEEKPSLMGGETGRAASDLAGLAMMAAPSAAALRHVGNTHAAGEGKRWVNALNLAGLAALAAPSIDHIQAGLRANTPEERESKLLLPHKAHAALEIGGLAGLAVPVAAGMRGQSLRDNLGSVGTMAGLGLLAAPHIEHELRGRTEGEHEGGEHFFTPVRKNVSDLAGLGLLAAPAAAHLLHKHGADEGTKEGSIAQEVWEQWFEKIATGPWNVPQARRGIRPMRVTTLLRKDAEGTLHKKLAGSLDALQVQATVGKTPYSTGPAETAGAAKTKRHPWEAPARDDAYLDQNSTIQQRADAMVLPGTGATLLVGRSGG